MNADERRSATNAITETIIGAAHSVSNALGAGFLEKVYEDALAHESRKRGLNVLQQHLIDVQYDGIIVGQYVADLLINDTYWSRSKRSNVSMKFTRLSV